ncbi:MAG TPA: 50S ribosomal protein L29 [Abditibacteriaceae bacterium]
MADLNNYISGGGKTVKVHEQRDRIRTADESELRELLHDVQAEVLNLRTQALLQQAPNPMRIRSIRKMVARINTELAARAAKTA